LQDDISSPTESNYSYVVKIIPPSKKSNYTERIWHHINEIYISSETRAKLKQSFSEQVPDTSDYHVGYFEKRHNRKHWNDNSDDMYSSYQCSDTIKLWCDRYEEKSGRHTQKESGKEKTVDTTKEDDKKHDKFESIVQELVDEHGDNYTEAQLRVWARLIVNGLHSSTSTPPNIPIITGEPAVKKRKIFQPEQDKSFTDILKNAVSVFAYHTWSISVANNASSSRFHSALVDFPASWLTSWPPKILFFD